MSIWERIKRFNENFDYEDSDDPELWLTIMKEQVDEIDDHLKAGREKKAINEFIDCILVGQQAVYLHPDYDVDRLTLERILDIETRIDSVQSKYRKKHDNN